jgi:hypothetical protein
MGYVNNVREYDWGVVYDMSHNQTQMKDGQWQTIGRDYFSVVGPEGGPRFAKNDMCLVAGTMKTAIFDKKDGSGKGIALNVRAESMELNAKTRPNQSVVEDVFKEIQELPIDNAPF